MSRFNFDLGGRVVLVTGASSGLGTRFAQVMAANGAAVVLAARRTDLLLEHTARIEAEGGRAMAVAMDVTDETSVIATYDQIEKTLGPVDSVIANAGGNVEGLPLDLAVEDFDRIFAVNVRGVFLTVREAARRMIIAGSPTRKHGRIVIISSITADSITPGTAPYSASKAAVLQLGRVLARDWANRGICVNCIQPGYIETDINADWFKTEGGAKQIAKWPRRRLMSSDSLDAMALYLASDSAAEVTGCSYKIDDGQTLG